MNQKKRYLISTFVVITIVSASIGLYSFFKVSTSPDWNYTLSVSDYPDSPGLGWTLVNPGKIPISNPLKGFMPYMGEYNSFPYSMEYTYIPVSDVVGGSSNSINLAHLESNLTEVASKGNQLVFRFFFDYPGYLNAVPQYLIDDGLEMNEYTAFGGGFNPDYDDPRMIELMVNLIEELGTTYDGDPRIAFIQIGLLGHWGEWHTYPDEEDFANETTQNTILSKFDQCFNETKLVARYVDPITKQYNIGFHDDSFVHSTLCEDDWCFHQPFIDNDITNRWETEVIGGEVRPEYQVDAFREKPRDSEDIMECIDITHASWMLITSVFDLEGYDYGNLNQDELERAAIASSKLGYLFAMCYYNTSYNSGSDEFSTKVMIHNFGVAPFYYNWSIEFGILDSSNYTIQNEVILTTIDEIPSGTSLVLNYTYTSFSTYSSNGENLAIRIINPLNNGKPVLFANEKITDKGWSIFCSYPNSI